MAEHADEHNHPAEGEVVDAPTVQEDGQDNLGIEGDFDPERAKRTIRSQRDTERDLRAQLKQHEQAAQLLESLQSDPAVQDQLFRELAELQGWDLEDAQQAAADEQQAPVHDPRVDQLLAQQEEQALLARTEQGLDTVAKAHKRELSTEERDLIVAYSVNLPWNGDTPDVEAGFKALQQIEDAAQERYLKTKRAPHVTQAGTAAAKQVDFNNEEERVRFLADSIAANME